MTVALYESDTWHRNADIWKEDVVIHMVAWPNDRLTRGCTVMTVWMSPMCK
jgi:hypothetical protein